MTNPITQISLGMANVFIVRGQDGCILVDAGTPNSADDILSKLKVHGIAPNDIRLILITHGHIDHFGSAAALREQTGAPVAVHTLDAGDLRQDTNPQDNPLQAGWLVRLLMRTPGLNKLFGPDNVPPCPPDIEFEGAETRLDEYGVAGRVILTPGHTHGSVTLLTDSGEAIVGDAVMGKLMGMIRKPGPPIVAYDLEQNRQSMRRLLDLSPHTIYVGHGGPFSAQKVAEFIRS